MPSRPAPALPSGGAPIKLSPSERRPRLVGPPVRRALRDTSARVRAVTVTDVAVATVFVTIFSLAVTPMVDPDVFWHLATGRHIWSTHSVPRVDPFSWTTPGRSWIAHEWLTETGMYGLHRLGGSLLLVLVFASAICGAFFVAYRTARALGAARGVAAAMTLLGAVASAHTWGVRPQMLSLLLTASVMAVLTRVVRTGRVRLLWALPPVLLVWVNLHGAFVFGLVLVALFAGTELVTSWRWTGDLRVAWALWAAFGASLAATLVNPNGVAMLAYPFTYLGDNASTRYIDEWQAPKLTAPGTLPLLVLLALGVAGLALARPRPGLRDLALTMPFAYLAVTSARNVGLLAVVSGPLAAAAVSRAWMARRAAGSSAPARPAPARPAPLLLGALALGAAAMVSTGISRAGARDVLDADFPVTTAASLPTDAAGTLLNSYDFGGYLTWYRPDIPVYVDGRPDMYGDDFMDAFMRLTFARGAWRTELDRRGVRYALLQPTLPLAQALATEPGWRFVGRDRASVLFAR